MKYRADINGLRAVAVVPIVLYHAGVNAVSGGFVGVDIFFVISGFLITTLIVEEMNEDRFSLWAFYERRARRILPALFAMLGVVLVAGVPLLLATDFQDLARSAIASSLFFSNVHFWQASSYFASGSDLKPLLHTWSLAVEEQFYIIFPAFLLLVARVGGKIRHWLAGAFLLSFALAVWGAPRYPDATFYLAPTRAWELLTGGLLALGAAPDVPSRKLREALGLAGLAMILWSAARYDEGTVFPGLAAVPPCLGAALIIHARGSMVNRFLSLRPVVFIGVISYSLYLWHWPIVVFARYEGYFFGTPSQIVGVLALTFAAAVLSWRFVEIPFKGRTLIPGRQRLLGAAGTGIAAMVLAASGLGHLRGADATVEAAALEKGRAEARAAYGEGVCFFSSDAPLSEIKPNDCLAPDPHKRNYLLIGDSFAAHLWPGLTEALPAVNMRQLTFGGCPPLLNSVNLKDPGCRKVTQAVFEAAQDTRYDAILLAAHWRESEDDELEKTIRFLKPLTNDIVLFGPMVEYRGSLPEILSEDDRPQRAAVKYRIVPNLEDRRMRALADRLGVRYVSLVDLMCSGKHRCTIFDDAQQPIQWDNGHLTPQGSEELMDKATIDGSIPSP